MIRGEIISLPTAGAIVNDCMGCEGNGCATGDIVRWAQEGKARKPEVVSLVQAAMRAQTAERSPLSIDDRQMAIDEVFDEHVDVFDDVPGLPFNTEIIDAIGAGALACLMARSAQI